MGFGIPKLNAAKHHSETAEKYIRWPPMAIEFFAPPASTQLIVVHRCSRWRLVRLPGNGNRDG
jgi:hypothetical protein